MKAIINHNMRALKSDQFVAECPVATEATKVTEVPTASLSLRVVTALEIASVIISVLLAVWAIVPLQPDNRWVGALPGLLALALMINSHRLRGETPSELGFTLKYFGRAIVLLLAPMLITSLLLIVTGYLAHSLHFGARFQINLLLLPFWGLTQQYILQAFIYRRLKLIFIDPHVTSAQRAARTRLAIFLAALLFALVHAPNLTLMALTLIGGLVWSWVYERAPNLLALGLSHGVMSALAMASLPQWFLQSMSVGYKYFIYQKF